MPWNRVLTKAVLACLLCPRPGVADDSGFQERAQRLATLRADLEQIESDLQAERETQRNELRALAAQEEELGLLIRKERIRLQTLEKQRDRKVEERASRDNQSARLVGVITDAVGILETVVAKSLPFHIEDRLKDLEDIRRDLESGQSSPETAASRLWQFVEDELKLCSESGLDQQVVEVDGKRQLVDTARLGMVVMYYRAADGTLGYTVPTADGFRFEPILSEAGRSAVVLLFESLKKQIRTGRFDLPLELTVVKEGRR